MEITEILRHGVITEKTVKLQEQNKYTFKVALEANKIDVRRAVETMFNVKVVSVNIIRMPGKVKMFSGVKVPLLEFNRPMSGRRRLLLCKKGIRSTH